VLAIVHVLARPGRQGYDEGAPPRREGTLFEQTYADRPASAQRDGRGKTPPGRPPDHDHALSRDDPPPTPNPHCAARRRIPAFSVVLRRNAAREKDIIIARFDARPIISAVNAHPAPTKAAATCRDRRAAAGNRALRVKTARARKRLGPRSISAARRGGTGCARPAFSRTIHRASKPKSAPGSIRGEDTRDRWPGSALTSRIMLVRLKSTCPAARPARLCVGVIKNRNTCVQSESDGAPPRDSNNSRQSGSKRGVTRLRVRSISAPERLRWS